MHSKSLWIKASAKCINVKYRNYLINIILARLEDLLNQAYQLQFRLV